MLIELSRSIITGCRGESAEKIIGTKKVFAKKFAVKLEMKTTPTIF